MQGGSAGMDRQFAWPVRVGVRGFGLFIWRCILCHSVCRQYEAYFSGNFLDNYEIGIRLQQRVFSLSSLLRAIGT